MEKPLDLDRRVQYGVDVRMLVCGTALVLLGACYQSEGGRPERDGGGALDAADTPDAGCIEGHACDDGDACTVGDRCSMGACVGAPHVCESPPDLCFASVGACIDGECVYAPQDGASCDDGDACTVGDRCLMGVCVGAPLVCESPPAARCVDDRTVRSVDTPGMCDSGGCHYTSAERVCLDGCVDGACLCFEREWAVEPLAPASAETFRVFGIEVDAGGGIHIAYSDRSDRGELMYGHRPLGGTWSFEPVGGLGDGFGSFAVDSGGVVHIFARGDGSAANEGLHARRDGGRWTISNFTVPAPDEGFSWRWEDAMTIVGGGTAHMVLSRPLTTVYAVRAPDGRWSVIDEWDTPVGSRVRAIEVDRDGAVSILSTTEHYGMGVPAHFEVVHRHRSPSGLWTVETIDTFQVNRKCSPGPVLTAA